MIKLWFVPEILVFVREMSLKFDFWGRHACWNTAGKLKGNNSTNMKGSNFLSLQNFRSILRFDFFCHVQNNERS